MPRLFHEQLKPREIYVNYWWLLCPWCVEQWFFLGSISAETNVSFCIYHLSTALILLSSYLVSLVDHVLSEIKNGETQTMQLLLDSDLKCCDVDINLPDHPGALIMD